MSGLNKVLSLAIVIGCIFSGIVFFQGAISATDEGIDMSGSAYEDTYDTTTTIAIQSITMMNVVLLILAIMAVVVAIKAFSTV